MNARGLLRSETREAHEALDAHFSQFDLSDARGIRGFRDLKNNHLEETDDGLLITDGRGDSMLLEGLGLADIARGDFIF